MSHVSPSIHSKCDLRRFSQLICPPLRNFWNASKYTMINCFLATTFAIGSRKYSKRCYLPSLVARTCTLLPYPLFRYNDRNGDASQARGEFICDCALFYMKTSTFSGVSDMLLKREMSFTLEGFFSAALPLCSADCSSWWLTNAP